MGREYLRDVRRPGLMNSRDDTPSERIDKLAIRQCVILPIVLVLVLVVAAWRRQRVPDLATV